MNKIIIHSSLIIIALIMGYVILNYWKNKLLKEYKLTLNNLPYGIFMSSQMLSVFVIIYFGTDPLNSMYIEQLPPMSASFWSIFGIELLVFFACFLLCYLISMIFYRVIISTGDSLFEEIYNEKVAPILIHAVVMISFSILISNFLVKPYIYDWVVGMVGLVPMN